LAGNIEWHVGQFDEEWAVAKELEGRIEILDDFFNVKSRVSSVKHLQG